MDVKTISTLIDGVGFPIVVCIGMGYFIWQLYKQSVERENKLYTINDECRAINAKAIETIATYAEKLDTIQHDVKEIKDDLTLMKIGGKG